MLPFQVRNWGRALPADILPKNSFRFPLKNFAGFKFENLVFLTLRQHTNAIYYYVGKGECDFLMLEKGVIKVAIQVCLDLNSDNLQRELAGLTEAMKTFQLEVGYIVTVAQTDSFLPEGLTIKVIPYHDFVNITESIPLSHSS